MAITMVESPATSAMDRVSHNDEKRHSAKLQEMGGGRKERQRPFHDILHILNLGNQGGEGDVEIVDPFYQQLQRRKTEVSMPPYR